MRFGVASPTRRMRVVLGGGIVSMLALALALAVAVTVAVALAADSRSHRSAPTQAVSAQSRASQVAAMHRQEVMAFEAAVGSVTKGHGLALGQPLLSAIVNDEPSLRGIVTLAAVGSRGHIGVGQTTEAEFVAVGETADGAVVRYSAIAPRGL